MAKKKVTITTKKGKAGRKEKENVKKTSFTLGDIPDEVAGRAREIWLAGLGALSSMQEEGAKVFNDLVSKGETWENERMKDLGMARQKVEASVEEATSRGKEVQGQIDERVDKIAETLDRVLDRLGTVVRGEVQELAGRVEELSRRVDALAEDVGEGASVAEALERTVYVVAPHPEGWAVQKQGADRATSVHDTKKEALEAGRATAGEHTPSQLIVKRQDGTVQDSFTYGEV